MIAAGSAASALAGGGNPAMQTAELGPAEFARIAAIMQSDARIALSEAKTTLVQSRLARRLREHGLSRFKDYVELVERDAAERNAMVVALTTNHTHFFREPHHFDHFRSVVLPRLKANAHAGVRIWSAGCSSGEEVHTIAMCLLGESRSQAGWVRGRDVKFLATDIAPHVVEATRRGVYSDQTVNPVPASYRDAWMRRQGGDWVIADEVRAMITANVLNLFGAWPMKRQFDVIFCRNVMIYFDDDAKSELEARLVEQLAPGGHLYIGHSERLIGPAAARMKSCGHTIYQKESRA